VDELEIHFRRRVAGINQHKGAAQRRPVAEVVAHGGVELLAPGLGDMGITVAGQIHEAPGAVDREKIQQLGLAGQVGDARQVFFLRQQVDEGGLAHVGAADEGKLRQPGGRTRGEVGGAVGKEGGLDFHGAGVQQTTKAPRAKDQADRTQDREIAAGRKLECPAAWTWK
jgi:hypothetical protein